MTTIQIEEIHREEALLIRSCRVKINGSTIVTPTKTISTSLNTPLNPDLTPKNIRSEKVLGEVFVSLSEQNLKQCRDNNSINKRFSSKLSDRVSELKQYGILPYIQFSIYEDPTTPLNRLLSDELFTFMLDCLWGIQGNSIIAMPLLGTLQSTDDYNKFIETFHKRQIDSIERKNQPLMGIIPSSYLMVDSELLKKYWNAGVRIFGYDCENKKFGAHSPIIERIQHTLSEYSKQSGESYIVNAINSKFKVGKDTSSRIHSLISTGYGFDIYSQNHIRSFGSPSKTYVFNDTNYGFIDVNKLNDEKQVDKIINTTAFKKIDLSEINQMDDDKKRALCKQHEIEKVFNEIQNYHKQIVNDQFVKYLGTKEKIKMEKKEIETFHYGTYAALNGWLK